MTIRFSTLGLALGAAAIATGTVVTPAQADNTQSQTDAIATHTSDDSNLYAGHHSEAKTIVDIAASKDEFSTLVAAIQAAGLVETLSGEGPFTVFAPTNEAFAALPEGTVESLLLPENLEALQTILTYHVVAGAVESTDLSSGPVTTVATIPVEVMVEDGTVMVGDATVTMADVTASNGVIHVIDTVLLPPTP